MTTNNAVNTSLSGQTGTGTFVGANTPTLITPVIGAATGSSIALGGGTPLANYLESTWTPTVTLVGGAGNTVPVYTTNSGSYTRIGNICHCIISLAGDGGAEGAGTGVLTIALPITSSNTNIGSVAADGNYLNGATRTIIGTSVGQAATTFTLFPWTSLSTGYGANLVGNDQNNVSRSIYLKFFYWV